MRAKLWFVVAVLAAFALPAVAQEEPTTQPTTQPPGDVNVDVRETENNPPAQGDGGGVNFNFGDATWLLVLVIIVALVLIAVAALAGGHGPPH